MNDRDDHLNWEEIDSRLVKSCCIFDLYKSKRRVQTMGRQAPTGFEPVHKGFADLSLTPWVRRLKPW